MYVIMGKGLILEVAMVHDQTQGVQVNQALGVPWQPGKALNKSCPTVAHGNYAGQVRYVRFLPTLTSISYFIEVRLALLKPKDKYEP